MAAVGTKAAGPLQHHFVNKIEAAELEINAKTQNLRRLEAQRNALNARGTSLPPPVRREESGRIEADDYVSPSPFGSCVPQ
jgi:hypothetical protein